MPQPRRWIRMLTATVIASGTVVALATVRGPDGTAAAASDTAGCRPTQFHVATGGNDRNPGTRARPWRTIQHARDHIARHGLNSPRRMRCDIDVDVAAGTYRVTSTIAFGTQDSGANGHRVVYRSSDGPGAARLIGARRVTGWQLDPAIAGDHVYRTQVGTADPIYTLFEGHSRATTARYPNRGADESWAPYLRSTLNPDYKGSQVYLSFPADDWKPSWDLHDAQAVVWSGGSWSWFTDTDPIKNVNWSKHVATLSYPTRYPIQTDDPGSRYYLQNSLDFLDQPGEYYWDSSSGWLYYWPKTGDITAHPIYAPTVTTLLSVAGSSAAAPVHDLAFDGLAVEYSNFVNWYRFAWNSAGDSGEVHRYPDYDRQIELPRNRFGAVTLSDTKRVELRRLRVTNTGWEGIYLTGRVQQDTVADSYFAHLGGDGIKVEGPYPGEGDIANHNRFVDNYFNYFGELVPGDASAVELLDSGHNVVSHSVIEHSARYAVSMRAVTTATNADDYAQGNRLSYLRIAHVGEDSGDTGALYAYGVQNFDPHVMNSSISQVTIDDVNADPSMLDSPPRGVHMDFGGCGFVFSDIQVTDVQGDPYHGPSDECNTFHNDSWQPDFDATQLQYPRIGLTSTFPYRATA